MSAATNQRADLTEHEQDEVAYQAYATAVGAKSLVGAYFYGLRRGRAQPTPLVRPAGIALRDQFAMAAPIELSDAMDACGFSGQNFGELSLDERRTVLTLLVGLRFKYADIMIVERAQ
jgi:hypothetical protein